MLVKQILGPGHAHTHRHTQRAHQTQGAGHHTQKARSVIVQLVGSFNDVTELGLADDAFQKGIVGVVSIQRAGGNHRAILAHFVVHHSNRTNAGMEYVHLVFLLQGHRL